MGFASEAAAGAMTVEYECDDFNEITCFFRWRGTVLYAAEEAIEKLRPGHCEKMGCAM